MRKKKKKTETCKGKKYYNQTLKVKIFAKENRVTYLNYSN